jgi:hypothetical protein
MVGHEGGIMAGAQRGFAALVAALVIVTGISQPSAQQQDVAFTRPASDAEEIALALEALPASMRPAATVHVLGPKGYRVARVGTSGVHCLVERGRPDTQEPICWDREGSETIMPVAMDREVWRAEGLSEDAIEVRIAERFANGRYRAPRRPGMAYMLSASNYVFNGERVIHFGPHLMSYAPYLTNADIGTDGTDPNAPWILNEGSPHAYMILVSRHDAAAPSRSR